MNRSTNQSPDGTGGCIVRAFALVALSGAVAALVVLGVIVAADEAAHAVTGQVKSMNVTPYPGKDVCAQLWEHPHTREAQACRDKGWVIQRHLIVNRNNNAWTDLRKCPTEDSERCYWNARLRGNHRGHSFVQLGRKGTFYVRSINGRRG